MYWSLYIGWPENFLQVVPSGASLILNSGCAMSCWPFNHFCNKFDFVLLIQTFRNVSYRDVWLFSFYNHFEPFVVFKLIGVATVKTHHDCLALQTDTCLDISVKSNNYFRFLTMKVGPFHLLHRKIFDLSIVGLSCYELQSFSASNSYIFSSRSL